MEFRIRDIVIGDEFCNILLVEGKRTAPCTLTTNHNAQLNIHKNSTIYIYIIFVEFFSQKKTKYTKVRPEKF